MVTANPTWAKDRKILKLIDHDAMRASMVEVLSYIVVTAWVLVPGGFYEQSPVAAVIAAGFIVLVGLMRIALNLMFDSMYGGGPLRWRRSFFFLNYLQAVGWSLFAVVLFFYQGLSENTFFVLSPLLK